MQNGQFGSKIKNVKKVRQNDCTTTLKLLCSKNSSKKHLIFEKWEHFENGQNWPRCMGYSPCKMVSLWSKIKNARKGAKNDCTTTLELLCAKNRSKKHLILEKWDHFQNGQNWPRRKGYSLWRTISLCSRIKNAKNVRILRFCHHVGVVLCKKLLRKTP